MLRAITILFVAVSFAACSRAQEIKSAPGDFDFYLLNLSWGPSFCNNLETLTPIERAAATPASLQCTAPKAFALHGLWPSRLDKARPAYCTDRNGPAHPEHDLDITPSLALLQHEWAKHGTCTLLSPETFFQSARSAAARLRIPQQFKHVDHEFSMPSAALLALFQKSNPRYPANSLVITCPKDEFTAIEACLDKDLKPIACTTIPACTANAVHVAATRK